MRATLLLLALLGAGGLAWWLLRGAPAGSPDDLVVPAGQGGRAPPAPLEAARPPEGLAAPAPRVLPRVGVVDPSEGRPAPDPQAGPWEEHVVRPVREAGQPLGGAALLEAIGERLYVRVRQPADLEALRALRLDSEEAELPVAAALHLLEAQGWKWAVMDPRLLLYPAAEAERTGPREPPR